MVSYHIILLDFLEKKFGPTISKELFKLHMNKEHIDSFEHFESLSLVDQHKFIDKLLLGVFQDFYDKEYVLQISLASLFRFFILEHIHTFDSLQNSSITCESFDLKSISKIEYIDLKYISGSKDSRLIFSLQGDLTGLLSISYSEEDLIGFVKLLQPDSSSNLKSSLQVIKNYFSEVLSKFEHTVNQVYGKSISFVLTEKTEVLETELKDSSRLFCSDTETIIDSVPHTTSFFVVLNDN